MTHGKNHRVPLDRSGHARIHQIRWAPPATSMSATGDVAPAPEDGRQMRRKPPRRKPPRRKPPRRKPPMEAATTPPLCGPRRPGPPHPPRLQDHPLHPVDRAPGHQGPELPVGPAGPRRRLAGTRRNLTRTPRTPLDTGNIPLYIGEDFFLKKITVTSQYPGNPPPFQPLSKLNLPKKPLKSQYPSSIHQYPPTNYL